MRIALDDFGAGQSALRWLPFLPLDMLKIDRGFRQPLKDGPDAARITAGIVELAGRLGFTTVAEGIEDQEQAVILAALGAEMGQGYHFSRPLPESRLGELRATPGWAMASARPKRPPWPDPVERTARAVASAPRAKERPGPAGLPPEAGQRERATTNSKRPSMKKTFECMMGRERMS